MAESRRSCVSCGAPNEEDARFCEGCGLSLARICATCGVEASATARFCRGCGASLDDQEPAPDVRAAAPVRKTVTVMFADLAGSTTFEENVDAETARDVIGRYHDLLRSVAQRHRAGVTKYIGDGFMAVWGVPEIGPDDAAHAVDAAVALQEQFVELAADVVETHGAELALRVAVNTGEVVVGAGDADLVGDALNVGARLEAECPRGRVVVGEETWRATRGRYEYESLGQVQVKGRTAAVAVYQWLGRHTETTDAAPFVGRGDEMRRLQAVLGDAIAARQARMVTVIGDPGVGKSRLAAEFTGTHGEARVVEARCVLEGTVALAPLVEVLSARDLETDIAASIPERDRLLRDLNGLVSGVAGSVEENFWALRRFVEVLAADQPVLLVLDDIQWADTLLIDFIEHLVEWVQEVPVLVLALARPELRESRPDLVTVSRWVSEAVHLGGLDAGATAELAAKVLGAARLPDDLLRRLPSSTGGNPLFVRELIGMLAHDGVLVERPTGWRLTIDVDAITIPPTIHALLASRLERLDPADRRVLEIASVVGSDFSLGTVRALAGASVAGVELSLNRLRRLELAQPSGAYVGDEPVWRFHHVLIRDVAYRRLLKSERAELHERLAAWVEAGGSSVAFDADEMVARHLEAAHRYRLELGTVGEHTGELALRAAGHYAASARRALDRDELVSAGTQAARGASLASADAELHAELLLIGCEAFLSAGDVAAGAPLVDDLERIADDALSPWAICYRCQFIIYTDPNRLLDSDARLQGAIDEFGRRRDHAGLAKAHRVRASARSRLGRIGDCEADLFEALIAARRSGDHRQITAALGAAPSAALWGPSPVPKAGGRCLDVVRMQRMTTAAPSLEATSLRCLAVLELLRGRPDKARTMLADARQVVADLGLRHGLMETELFAGIIESMEGDPVAAEPHFRTALEGLDALGVGADAGQAAALLAKSVLAQGRVDEADTYATESEQLAGRNLKTAIAWRAVRAEILAAQGRHDEAAAMARDAVSVAAGTDLVLDHADACLALSRVLAATGDGRGANDARGQAEALYAAKEVASSIGRVIPDIAPTPPHTVDSAPAASAKLAVRNLATETGSLLISALNSRDVDAGVATYSDHRVYDDRRRLSGDPIEDLAAARAALERICQQYNRFNATMLAVRGERLALADVRMSDDSGNETAGLILTEVDDDGLIVYEGRFDEDFEAAYRELDRRYSAGEGAASAEAGAAFTEWALAVNRADFDRLFGELTAPDFRIENRSRSAFPDRSAAEYRTTLEQLAAMVVSARAWSAAERWLSPTCGVFRCARDAIGKDGEHYAWSFLLVAEFGGGRIASICEFEPDDEAGAFAYAEQRIRATTSQLAVSNRASEKVETGWRAMRAHDADAVVALYADVFVYDDRRRLSGEPVLGHDAMRSAVERDFEQYPYIECRPLAVRGQRLVLDRSRMSDDAGNETTDLHVREIDDDGLIVYDGRFDEDNFESAIRELERRYYAAEGAAFAEEGLPASESVHALNRGDYDQFFGEYSTPDLSVENRTRSAFPDRSAAGLRASFGDLNAMVASAHTWMSTVCWLSPAVSVTRLDREAVGEDGEQYAWTRLIVSEHRDGRFAAMCEFEPEDEQAAFAHAEERVHATTSRLAVTNRSCDSARKLHRAMEAHDAEGILRCCSDRLVYDDRRRLSGDPISTRDEFRAAFERILQQYSRFEYRILAVRGERLNLNWSRWADDAGNETDYLHVYEIGDDGRQVYEGRFDEDDFDGAYRELERRYYAGEGADFAEAGTAGTELIIAYNEGDFDRMLGQLTAPDARFENRSSSVFPNRSVTEFRASIEELSTMVRSARTWYSALRWLSPGVVVARFEREAVGQDGEQYAWTRLYVNDFRDGLSSLSCQFEPDDEQAAFVYAEERVRTTASRLAVTNRATMTAAALMNAMNAADVEKAASSCYTDSFVYDDRRGISGDPIRGLDELRAAATRILQQYTRFETRPVAVRGDRLNMSSGRWSNDSGFESLYLSVHEVDDEGLFIYEGRFDEDDFDGAYRVLEDRYYAGEGAPFSESGNVQTDYAAAMNRGDLDRAFGGLTSPDFRIENRSRSIFGDRSAPEFRASLEGLDAMFASIRMWDSAVHWLSPNWCVARSERDAVGKDRERYAWTHVSVTEVRGGRFTSACLFDVDDEDAAFAYAEEHMRATSSRLPVTNRAREVIETGWRAMQSRNVGALVAVFADRFAWADHRQLAGDPIEDHVALRRAADQMLAHYGDVEWRTLAVRGESLHWAHVRWSNAAGYVTAYLHLCEVGEDDRIIYDARFDEGDFDDAYRELNRRYYAGEGAAFAAGAAETEYMIAYNQRDFDRVNELSSPDLRLENRSRSAFPDRSMAEFRESTEELNSMVSEVRTWSSALHWISPTCCVTRNEREAVGSDGERFAWTRIFVGEVGDGRLTALCQFDVEDEDGAFAYAEERMRATPARLPIANQASETAEAVLAAMRAHNADEVASHYSDALVYDDRRQLAGVPFSDMRTAMERVLEQYTQFEGRILAVRGERTYMGWTRWTNEAGFESAYLGVQEIGNDGRFVYQARFDEDDFDGAYRMLEERYYAGEGAAFADVGAKSTELVIALNHGEFDRVFSEFVRPDGHIEDRSRSIFGDRTAAQLRTSLEELYSMVGSARTWFSAVHWLSPTRVLFREQREAIGQDDEHYAWARLYVFEFRDGLITSACQFDIDDEDAAIAFAEERARAATSRLSLENVATRTWDEGQRVLKSRDTDAAVKLYADPFVYDDRRRLGGNPIDDIRTAHERVVAQYSRFEGRTLAVRGERLHLVWSRWSNESDFETCYLIVHEVNERGQVIYEGRFDEDNFEDAYRELTRRYSAGDGASFDDGVAAAAEYLMALNGRDFDRLSNDLVDPDMRVENRTRSGFPDRSAAELRASHEELNRLVASTRSWHSAECWLSPNVAVMRHERRADGQDGEQYEWTRLVVGEVADGRVTAMCAFEPEDEEAAFAYADERVRNGQQS